MPASNPPIAHSPDLRELQASVSGQPTVAVAQRYIQPFVQHDGPIKSLHFTLDELQSQMNQANPWQLEVDYTRTMMGFLLLRQAPAHIAMVGLGGGSLAKFCYRQLPQCHISVAEINPHVIALRRDFQIPDDDERFKVIEADGAEFVAHNRSSFDALLVDGFDHHGQPAALCSQRFYDDCFAALAPEGVMAVNLHYDDADFPLWAGRIQRSFNGNTVEIPALEKSNCIVFASRGSPLTRYRIDLRASLAGMERAAVVQLKAEFIRIAWNLRNLAEGASS